MNRATTASGMHCPYGYHDGAGGAVGDAVSGDRSVSQYRNPHTLGRQTARLRFRRRAVAALRMPATGATAGWTAATTLNGRFKIFVWVWDRTQLRVVPAVN